jgi:dihydrofolate reductase
MINLIVAVSQNGVIGNDNKLIWKLPNDLKRFKKLTTPHNIIMGRKTFDSIGKALPNRQNIVITRNKDLSLKNCIVVNSLESAVLKSDKSKEVFIIGGSQIYRYALEKNYIDKMYITKIHKDFEGDSFFTFDEKRFKLIESEKHSTNDFDYEYLTYIR